MVFIKKVVLIMVCTIALCPSVGEAQTAVRDSAAAKLANNLRTRSDVANASQLLQQSDGFWSPAKRSVLSDSLTSLVIKTRGSQPEDRKLRFEAILAISNALESGSESLQSALVPKLVQIARIATDPSDRAVAIASLSYMQNKAAAVQWQRNFALANNSESIDALRELHGPLKNYGGMTVLQDLNHSSQITEAFAKAYLVWVASKEGWK